MLEQRQGAATGQSVENGVRDEDDLPVIPLDEAYHRRVAERIKEMTGEFPLWYTATPQELADSMQQWAESLREYWEGLRAAGVEPPQIPLEALRREHIYEETF